GSRSHCDAARGARSRAGSGSRRGHRLPPILAILLGTVDNVARPLKAGRSAITQRSPMDRLEVQAVVYREAEHYVAQCLNVDVSSFGDTETEALANLQEALELYFEDMPETVVAPVEAPEVRQLTVQHA